MTDSEDKSLSSRKFSEAIHTIAPELVKMVRNRMFNPHFELECLILSKTLESGKVTNQIPMEDWKNILRDVLRSHHARMATKTDDKKWPATEDKFYLSGRVRERISKITGDFQSTWIQKDHVERQLFVIAQPQLPYGFCVSLKREKPLTEGELKNKGEVCFIRDKQSFTIWWLKQPFRTDFTLTHSAPSRERMKVESSLTACYQIETEFVSDETNLAACQMTLDDFAQEYDIDSPFVSHEEMRKREYRVAMELLELSLLLLNPQKATPTLSLHAYPEALYVRSGK